MFVRKPDGSITSIRDTDELRDGWVEITEDEARAEHPALTGHDTGQQVERDGMPPLTTIPEYAPTVQVGELDPRIIESTPSVGEAEFSRRNERPADVARRAAEQAAEPTP